jgi:hypothetical protein
MTLGKSPDLTPIERTQDLPRILQALREAAEEAFRRHKLDGDPIAVWRNGRVEWIPPEEIPDRLEADGD